MFATFWTRTLRVFGINMHIKRFRHYMHQSLVYVSILRNGYLV